MDMGLPFFFLIQHCQSALTKATENFPCRKEALCKTSRASFDVSGPSHSGYVYFGQSKTKTDYQRVAEEEEDFGSVLACRLS